MRIDRLLFKKEIVLDLNFDNLKSNLKNYKSVHIEKRKIGSEIILLGFIYSETNLNSSKVIEGKIIKYNDKCKLIVQLSLYYLVLVTILIALILLIAFLNEAFTFLTGLFVFFSLLVFLYLFLQLVFQDNIKKLINELKNIKTEK